MAKTPKTRAEKRLTAAPAEAFRKLTKTELEKLGLSVKSERFIEIGRRVAKNVKTISKRLFTIKKTGATPEALAQAHAEGELIYKSRKTKEAAEKQKTTRARQREKKQVGKILSPLTSKQIDRAAKNFEKKLSNAPRAVPGPNSRRGRTPYKIDAKGRGRVVDIYRKKLAGDFIPDGEWHMVVDAARGANDRNLGRLLQSKQDKSPEYDWETDIDLEEAA